MLYVCSRTHTKAKVSVPPRGGDQDDAGYNSPWPQSAAHFQLPIYDTAFIKLLFLCTSTYEYKMDGGAIRHFPSFQSSSNGFSIKYAGVTLSPHAMMMIYLTVLSDHSWIFLASSFTQHINFLWIKFLINGRQR